MRIIHAIFFLILLSCCSLSENDKVHSFYKKIYDLKNPQDSIEFNNWVLLNYKNKLVNNCDEYLHLNDSVILGFGIYQDKKFKVFQTCLGEFGGKLMFQDRNNPEFIYYMRSTCPIMIEKLDGEYYILESLAHGSGNGRIIKLTDPKSLIKVFKDSLDIKMEWEKNRFPNLKKFKIYEILSSQNEVILDTFGVIFNSFFIYKLNFYIIYYGNQKTYLGKIINNNIETIDTLISCNSYYNDHNIPTKNIDGIYHAPFSNFIGTVNYSKRSEGNIYVKDDTIVVGYRITETRTNSNNCIKKAATN